ncbi:hypothetical protein SAY86_008311 [Trapa natans]|uniref:Uncharacterized protein n=1 Tax=Trapa natans TaxID=22666 RepID=A0AAN7QAQ5_TRANT|nr:hypothetical protein SAY86_008311 [Trapa natans]
MKEVKKELKKCLEEAQQYFNTVSGPKLALVIDGKCLMYVLLDPSLRVMLLNLSLNCNSVVCCWASPLQKAQVMNLMCNPKRIFVQPIFWLFIEKDKPLTFGSQFLNFRCHLKKVMHMYSIYGNHCMAQNVHDALIGGSYAFFENIWCIIENCVVYSRVL